MVLREGFQTFRLLSQVDNLESSLLLRVPVILPLGCRGHDDLDEFKALGSKSGPFAKRITIFTQPAGHSHLFLNGRTLIKAIITMVTVIEIPI